MRRKNKMERTKFYYKKFKKAPKGLKCHTLKSDKLPLHICAHILHDICLCPQRYSFVAFSIFLFCLPLATFSTQSLRPFKWFNYVEVHKHLAALSLGRLILSKCFYFLLAEVDLVAILILYVCVLYTLNVNKNRIWQVICLKCLLERVLAYSF